MRKVVARVVIEFYEPQHGASVSRGTMFAFVRLAKTSELAPCATGTFARVPPRENGRTASYSARGARAIAQPRGARFVSTRPSCASSSLAPLSQFSEGALAIAPHFRYLCILSCADSWRNATEWGSPQRTTVRRSIPCRADADADARERATRDGSRQRAQRFRAAPMTLRPPRSLGGRSQPRSAHVQAHQRVHFSTARNATDSPDSTGLVLPSVDARADALSPTFTQGSHAP